MKVKFTRNYRGKIKDSIEDCSDRVALRYVSKGLAKMYVRIPSSKPKEIDKVIKYSDAEVKAVKPAKAKISRKSKKKKTRKFNW